MPFAPGDRVHIPRLGTGIVQAVRNDGRYAVEIKGRTMVVDDARMERADAGAPRRKETPSGASGVRESVPRSAASIDLHGMTVEQAIEALDACINDALLASHAEVRIIHGRSGGRIRHAVHHRLRALAPVKSFRIDPRNAGVTIVLL
ncbi:MAG TPA: Smr/MutS family protein [Vicinamibacterales bacterium]|nr:Smr/MutS family protein [Vicinamibacterales bacterium]